MVARRLGFDLQSLEIFVTVCKTGSMTVTAVQTGLTQPAVSRQISNLEQRLGVTLIERGSRPVRPTLAGQRLVSAAEHLLSEATAIPTLLQNADVGIIPKLRLGLIDSLSDPLVPLLIKSLRDRVASISVATGFMEPLRHRLLKRELDAVVSADPFDDVDGFERFELFQEQFVVLVSRGEPPFGDEAEFRNFAMRYPMIRSGTTSGIALRVEQQFRRMRLEVPHAFSCETIESIVSLVAAGIGWSILTPVCVRKCVALAPAIQVLQMPGAGFSRHIYLVVRRGELGGFSRQLSTLCRRAIQKNYMPQLVAIAPWMSNAIVVAQN
ncbi:LysR family transcriptional regulator [Ensifer adhaerens]|nr:LysR family transcriptional regulator [Ensifer adhaerens]UAX97770.1 LysR family transcriptional regulator [Ensifer adhaerens]UAY05072.1 LysR family transcriptional regulator [Ensifer adhaerens]UAY12492.1 LysR family transcriptional regulator [Ensifer adhaerens]